MNQVDFLIIIALGANIYYGATRGLVHGVGDLVALFAALGLGSLVYPAPAALLRFAFAPPPVLRDLLAFILSAVGIAVGIGYLFAHIAARRQLRPALDWVGGGVAGGIIGAVLIGVLLLVSGAAAGANRAVERSALGSPFLDIVPRMHSTMDRLGLPIPKLVILPPKYEMELEPRRYGPQFMRLNFARLDGSMCIKCRGEMRFLGYRRLNGGRIAPKFRCARCGRTTDGCQSFEGMHAIYNQCPVIIARHGVKLNCGVWTNKDWVYPKGRCPVDGNVFAGVTEPPPADVP